MQLTENAPAKWESVIADLTDKQKAARENAELLQTERQNLALEAAMGGADAKKKLDKANAELARLTAEAEDRETAIRQAQQRLGAAREAEASKAEHARRNELEILAATAIHHAEEFTASLRQASSAGAQLKLIVRNMILRATPAEQAQLNRLLEPGIYMRAAQHAGLRSHLEFAGYTGLPEHIVSLEAALKVHLGRWITTNGTENTSGN